MANHEPTNEEIADKLDQIADLLEAQEANRFRVQAYRDGAESVRGAAESVAGMARSSGQEALQELPHIGEGIARIIGSIVQNGRSNMLERLQAETSPGEAFKQVPGIGEKLAGRIAAELNISTLAELEQAAHDGRLQSVEGFGAERVQNVRVSVAGLLSSAAQRRERRAGEEPEPAQQPDVETLLDVDQAYRTQAEAGKLRKIAPKRFNPDGEAWLPILHTKRGEWDFTALYSNTARAHELEKTDDWVVLYYERGGTEEQATAVTETRGPLEGKRVIRGREEECRRYYQQ